MMRPIWRRRGHAEPRALPAQLRALAAAIRAAYAAQDAPLATRLATLDTLADAAIAAQPKAQREEFASTVHGT